MNCKTCKHWHNKAPDRSGWFEHQDIINPVDPDTMDEMDMPFEVRHCSNPKLLFCERPVEANGFAVADGSTYMANLMTAEGFGCVLHETD